MLKVHQCCDRDKKLGTKYILNSSRLLSFKSDYLLIESKICAYTFINYQEDRVYMRILGRLIIFV
jgi:hypothetical protein